MTPQTVATATSDFERDGVAVVPRFLSNDDVDEVESEVHKYIRDVLPHQGSESAFYEDKSQPDSLFRLNGLMKSSGYFSDLANQPRFTSLAESLLQEGVTAHGVEMFAKAPRIGGETPAHQDCYYFNLEPNSSITLWVALDHADEENGCLRYVKGSHMKGLLPHEKSSTFGFSRGVQENLADASQTAMAVPVSPGDLIAHHGLTIHRADPNPSDRRRWAVGVVFFPKSAKVNKAARDARDRTTKMEWKNSDKL